MRIESIMASALVALALLSCKKEEQGGCLRFNLTEGQVAEIVTRGKVSDYATLPSEGNFNLTIKNSAGTSIYSGLLSGWNESTELPVGNYVAEASYGSDGDEGPDAPWFAGSANFTVLGAETTQVSIPVTLGNAIVKLECTDKFKNYYPSYSFRLSTPDNPAGFDCTSTAVFVTYQFSITASVRTQAGVELTHEPQTWKVDPACCYTVKYDVNNVGGTSITVSFSDAVETVVLDEIELN